MSEYSYAGRFRRFCRLFRREKPALIDVSYSFHYLSRFPRLSITVPPVVPTLMSYRWNDDDDNDLSPKNFLRHHQHALQPIRRRFSKRYSDIVRPASNKIYLPRRDSIKPNKYPSSTYKQSRTSFKRNNTEGLYVINASEKKTGEIFSSLSKKKRTEHSTRRYQSKNKQLPTANTVDLLAHRMQAAMSVELMHSLDRNFVFGEKKSSSINRSQSFHIPTQTSSDQWEKSHYYHVIPRVNESLEQDFKSLSSEEPTPDYDDDDDDDLVIRVMKNDEIGEEPTIDYDVSESSPMYPPDETSPTMYDLGISSSFIAPLTSITPNSEMDTHDQSPFPPTPPPLPDSFSEQTKITFRCRTIAESITPNHRLILKDQTEMKTKSIEDKSAFSLATDSSKKPPSKSSQLYLSKELLEKTTLRKVSHPVSRSYSTYGSISQFNDHPTDSSTFCPKTSIIDEQAFDGLSSSATTSIVIENESEHRTSSKIYNDYKRRASLTSVPIHHSLHSQSAIIHPMHTHIGLRSSTSSSSTTDKTSEMILSNKQMNVCVINQLNQHLTTRFRQQQREEEEEIIPKKTPQIIEEEKVNLYDEPQHISTCKTISTQLTELEISSIPPPPPPLPIGGFRTIVNQPFHSQRTSVLTLPREINSTGTSTTSSKLSDSRILRELRANRLFTKAQQHLEVIEPQAASLEQSSIETFIISPDDCHPISTSQSELELLFQKRAHRNV